MEITKPLMRTNRLWGVLLSFLELIALISRGLMIVLWKEVIEYIFVWCDVDFVNAQ